MAQPRPAPIPVPHPTTGRSQSPQAVGTTAPTADSGRVQWSGHLCVDDVATTGPDPKATLTASREQLQLQGTLGTFTLTPDTVTCIKRAGIYPWIWAGIRIHHPVPGLPVRLAFCPMGVRSRHLLASLKALGFPTA